MTITTVFRNITRGLIGGAIFAAAGAAAATPAAAQNAAVGRPVIAVTGGLTQYDLAGTGSTSFGSLRVQVPVGRFVIVEPAVTHFSYPVQNGPVEEAVWLPEVQAQAQLRLGAVRPYLGAGAGIAHQRFEDRNWTDVTASVAGGLRLDVAAGLVAGAELRVRSIDPFHGVTADWGFSLGWRL